MTTKTYGDSRCYANYFWSDLENGCVACKAGSFGTNCEKICPPGRYGKFCALECVCRTSYYCDKVKGCVSKATTTIFEGDNDSTIFTHPGFTHSIEPVTCMDRPIPNKGMISKMIMINGSVIIALLLVLIIIISIRKYLMFMYWKRKVKLDHAPLTMIDPVYSEAEGMSGDDIYIKQNKRNNEGDSRGKHPSCRKELGLMCFKV
ncbi:protein draper-like isoform X1 [Ostrea edulis]|uniref:protein draper-like isoform X1 n=1 Tax=Ostrea edulis TaxID=37623 RepID=UPI0024AFC2AE|nr:protein draper-like isoform X1 [Ostrea edulis]